MCNQVSIIHPMNMPPEDVLFFKFNTLKFDVRLPLLNVGRPSSFAQEKLLCENASRQIESMRLKLIRALSNL